MLIGKTENLDKSGRDLSWVCSICTYTFDIETKGKLLYLVHSMSVVYATFVFSFKIRVKDKLKSILLKNCSHSMMFN